MRKSKATCSQCGEHPQGRKGTLCKECVAAARPKRVRAISHKPAYAGSFHNQNRGG